MIELKGNELGWILRLADEHYRSKEFEEWVEQFKRGIVKEFLKQLMIKFHPNNFNYGTHMTKWILLTEEELSRLRSDEYMEGRESME